MGTDGTFFFLGGGGIFGKINNSTLKYMKFVVSFHFILGIGVVENLPVIK